MAQRYPILQTPGQDMYYSGITRVDQERGYQAYVSNEINQLIPENQNYQYEHVHRLQQPVQPYYTLQNNQQFCLPAQQTLRYQPSPRLIPRKNRVVHVPSQNALPKRLRIDGGQSNTDTQSQQQYYFHQMSQQTPPFQAEPPCLTSLVKYPLDTQSPINSSPSRSPILNTSLSPTSIREPSNEMKCSHLRHQPAAPAPISQACYRPTNLCMHTLPPSTLSPLQLPAESTTSSPLQPESYEREVRTVSAPTNNRQTEVILIQDDDTNIIEPELVIVSVKSPTIPAPDQTSSPPVLSPQTSLEESEVIYEPYVQPSLPLQQVQMQQTPAALPINNTVELNQFFQTDYDYPYQTTSMPNHIAPVQAPLYFALPPQAEQYNIPVYPRPGTPNPFYCPQPIITRPLQNPRRINRPYEYSMPPYQPYHTNTSIREFLPYEDQGFVLHPISHPPIPSRSKKQGLTKAELKRLKVRKFKLSEESKDQDDSCVICMDEYKDGDRLNVLDCNHEYHKDCLKDWLVKQRNCPLCRKEVYP